jgi:hypothetical protein
LKGENADLWLFEVAAAQQSCVYRIKHFWVMDRTLFPLIIYT